MDRNKFKANRDVIDKARAAYLGLAIGDALGATVEFMTPNEIKVAYGVHKDIVGGGWLKLKAGRVTDDTEMSLALGLALLSINRVDANAIATAFSEWMRGKPVDIGNTVRRGIVYYRNHGETKVPKSDFHAGNGACMRTLPIALATFSADRNTVIKASRLQAHITHHSDLADAGTEHVIELLQMALNNQSLSEMDNASRAFARENPVYSFDKKPAANPSGFIAHTLQAVFQSLYSTDNFEDCLVDVVNRGGDADTTGAIAGMLAGACYGMDAIPQRWIRKLDKKIHKLCLEQAESLINIAPISITSDETLKSQGQSQAFSMKSY